MNRYYRAVFNRSLGVMQAVPENSRACSKTGRGKAVRAACGFKAAIALSALTLGVFADSAEAYAIDGGASETVKGDGTGTRTSPWDVPSERFYVGYSGEGGLTISGGGIVNSDDRSYIGGLQGSSGQVGITGAGSTWNITDTLSIGLYGQGELNISQGGRVQSEYGLIGHAQEGEGVVNVSGPGSIWTADGLLDVGVNGKGMLMISDGGTVQARGGVVGRHLNSNGEVAVTGPGSALGFTADLGVGADGPGKLTIDSGAIVSAQLISVGRRQEGKGEILLRGSSGTRGMLESSYIEKGAGDGSITFDGGIVRATADEADFLRNFDAGDVTLDAGGAFIDSNGYDIGIGTELSGSGGLTKIGAGTLTLSGDNSTFGGTVSLKSGTLRVAHNNALGSHVFPLQIGGNGRILDYADGIELSSGIDLQVSGGDNLGLHVEDDAFATQSGIFFTGPDRTLHKTGSGTLRLSGNNSLHLGATTVDEGTLLVDGSIAQSALLTVNPGATLGGSGMVGDTTVSDGGILAPGGTAIGTLTVDGDLALSSGSILDYQLGAPGTADDRLSGLSDRLVVTGDLQLDGTLNLAQSTDSSDGTAGLGYYRLMTYGGDLHDNGLVVGNTPNIDADYDIQAGQNRVDLFIGAVGDDTLQHWQGGDGVWNATDTQWFNQDGEVPVAWAGNHAAFKNQPGDFNGGTVDVASTQRFAGLQFVDEGYRLQGSGSLETISVGGSEVRVLADRAEIATQITGTGGITKTEAGTLVLSGSNTYVGGTTLAGGAVSVSSDANLGHADGALTFDGGMLRVTGTDFNDTGRQILWGTHGGGFDIVDEANNFHLDQNLAGQGDLIKRGDGALTLAGKNAYGNTRVEGGWLLGDASSISGDIANAGVVAFLQDEDARFAGDITGLQGTDGTMIKDGAGNLALGGRSLLDWSVASGTLITEASRFAGDAHLDGTTAGLTFTDANNGVYGGAISGVGQLTLDGAGSVLLTGDSAGFAGSTAIHAGTLRVGDADGNGALGGSLDVLAGATLAGSGTVGSGTGSDVTIASGGTLAPGNSIGTLTVDGDLTFETGSRFEVEVDPEGTDTDLVVVTGTARLNGGSVAHIGAAGAYQPYSTYTILRADTLDGEFDAVSSDFAFLTPDLLYDHGAGTIDLQLERNDRDFASAARTRNQKATATGIESIGFDAGHEVYDAIVLMADNEDQIQAGFDALSGELHASTQAAISEDSRLIRDAANARLRRASGFAQTAGREAAQGNITHWVQAVGVWGRQDGDGNAARLKRDTLGLLLGGDLALSDTAHGGMLVGYTRASIRAGAGRGSAEVDSFHLGAYAGTSLGDSKVELRGGAFYGDHRIDTSRRALGQRLKDDRHAYTLHAYAELARSFEVTRSRHATTTVEPFARLAQVHQHASNGTENGGSAALHSPRERYGTTVSTLGIRPEATFAAGDTTVSLYSSLGWQHAMGDTHFTRDQRFDGSETFRVGGTPIARNSAIGKAGVQVLVSEKIKLGVGYDGRFGNGSEDHTAEASVEWRF